MRNHFLRAAGKAVTPSFITSDLVLHLDAGNASSYSGSGSTWSDISGNSRNATLINSPTYSSADGGSLVFDGNTKYATVASNTAFNLNLAFTTSTWIKRNGNGLQSQEAILARASGAPFGGYQLYIEKSTLLPSVYIFNSSGTIEILAVSTTISSSWINFATTFDGVTLRHYINATSAGSKASAVSTIGSTTQPLRIGGDGAGYAFNGNIAQVAVYNRELSASEISQNFNALRSRFGI
jgi:hypothetical protein